MVDGFPHSGYPIGWYQIGWTKELPPGAVVARRYFGREFVCYRDDAGEVHVTDAFCPHMGAHLGFGGVVEGSAIRCPFHGWTWGPDGQNCDIPYGSRRTLNLRLRTHPVAERDGIVLMWFHPDGESPSWEVPGFLGDHAADEFFDLYPACTAVDEMRVNPQMIVENIIDYGHLKFAHRWDAGEPELISFQAKGHQFVGEMRGFLQTARGVASIDVTNNALGLGLLVSPMSGLRETVQITATTPIDEDRSDVRISAFIGLGEAADPAQLDRLAASMVRGQIREVLGHESGDRRIWENQRYVTRPPHIPEEAQAFRALRSWAEQFYVSEQPASSAETAPAS